jgi:F420-non-reducing hydrogenase iron-sulfur subunit
MTVKRITFLQELLTFIGLPDRLHLEWISSAEAQKFVQVVTDFTDHIRKLGPNPLKSMRMPPPRAIYSLPSTLQTTPAAVPSKPVIPVSRANARSA